MPNDTKMTFLPSEMASEIRAFASMVTVSTPLSAADEGKVLENDQLVEQTALTINANGTYDTTVYNSVTVNVPDDSLILTAEDENKVVSNGALVAQTSSTFTRNGEYDTTLFSEITINVPDEGLVLSAADEGKVIQNGVPVAQTSSTFTANGTYDTTLFGEVTVNVPETGLVLSQADDGKVVSGGSLIVQVSSTVLTNGIFDTTLYGELTVSVPGSGITVTAQDMYKVVSNGSLISQVSSVIMSEGTFNTSLYGTIEVSVPTEIDYENAAMGAIGFLDLGAHYPQEFESTTGSLLYERRYKSYLTGLYLAGDVPVNNRYRLSGNDVEIDKYASDVGTVFHSCPFLSIVVFKSNVSLQSAAFFDCPNLRKVIFLSGFSVGEKAFWNCSNIREIYLLGEPVRHTANVGNHPFNFTNVESIYVLRSYFSLYDTNGEASITGYYYNLPMSKVVQLDDSPWSIPPRQ